MSESCAACGCKITNNQTADGIAVRHGAKLYCSECASMILPPEELARLTNPTTAKASAPASDLMADDDILAEEAPPSQPKPVVKKAGSTVAPALARSAGSSAKTQSPSSSRVQRAVSIPASRDSSESKRRVPTRSASVVPSAPSPSQSAGASRRYNKLPSSSRTDTAAGNARDDSGRNRNKKKDSTGLYIGLGVGAVVLMVGAYFVFGSSKPKVVAKEKPKESFVDNDKTPSYEYAQRGDDFLKKKDTPSAVRMYGKAAERAEKEGNTTKAKEYNMRSVSAEKASTLH
ncbi:MAG: hypothetical protein WCT04_01395 [Planctomycetota bacterium]